MPPIGVISYGLACVGFLVLTALLLRGRPERPHGVRLVGACAGMVLWGAVLALDSGQGPQPSEAGLLVDLLHYAAWYFLLDSLARSVGVGRTALVVFHGAWIGTALACLAPPTPARTSLISDLPGRLLGPAGMALATLGLAFLWLVLRNARAADRTALKPLLIALGLLFGYDLIMQLQAQFLPGPTSALWDARGLLAALTVPMIAVAAGRNPQWSPDFFVSRDVVFLTAAIAAAGTTFVAVSFGSRLIVTHGGTWGAAASLAFTVAAATVLVALLGWPGLRQRLDVFLNKHFYRSKYDYRAEWLRFIQTVSAAEPELDPRENAIRAVAQIIQSPGGVLFLRRDRGRCFAAECAWPQQRYEARSFATLPDTDAMVAFLEGRQWVIDVREWRSTPELYGDVTLPPLVVLHEECRIILPLLHGAGLIGFVVLDDPPTTFNPNYEDRDLLKTVGRHVATYIAQHEADRRLAESRQFEAYHRLTAFVMHDLKNLAAQLALIVANAERHKRNPAFVDDTIATVANSTRRMQRLIEQLQGREIEQRQRSVDLAEAVRRACERCELRRPMPVIVASDGPLVVEADVEQLTAALEHVIRNAQDATPADGNVSVALSTDGDFCLATVTDTGCGMTDEFMMRRLFKPFDTTKGSEGMGIGAYQLREYVQSIGGSVDVSSTPGRGTTFVVRLKKARALAGDVERVSHA